jgi:hypothetical protein
LTQKSHAVKSSDIAYLAQNLNILSPSPASSLKPTGQYMKSLPNHIVTVNLDSLGDRTKARWVGQFRIKCVLTNADRFKLDRMYAELLPPRDREVDEEVRLRAATIAELSVRVVDGPEWWSSTRGGQLMADKAPLYDLIVMCNEEEKKWDKAVEDLSKFEDSNAIVPDPNKP